MTIYTAQEVGRGQLVLSCGVSGPKWREVHEMKGSSAHLLGRGGWGASVFLDDEQVSWKGRLSVNVEWATGKVRREEGLGGA